MSFERMLRVLKVIIPISAPNWLQVLRRRYWLWRRPARMGDLGKLWRLSPISSKFGMDRGLPIDRYYIEQFLSANFSDIQGRVLEMGNDFYTRKFGGDRVSRRDVLSVIKGDRNATIVADLTYADGIESDIFDCIICTQTIQMIYDVRAAIHQLYRIVRPGGVILVTSHGISKICRREGLDPWGEYWHFTSQSLRRLFEEVFSTGNVEIGVHGNVLAATAFLHGLAAEEMRRDELDFIDPDYELLITVRARKGYTPPPMPKKK